MRFFRHLRDTTRASITGYSGFSCTGCLWSTTLVRCVFPKLGFQLFGWPWSCFSIPCPFMSDSDTGNAPLCWGSRKNHARCAQMLALNCSARFALPEMKYERRPGAYIEGTLVTQRNCWQIIVFSCGLEATSFRISDLEVGKWRSPLLGSFDLDRPSFSHDQIMWLVHKQSHYTWLSARQWPMELLPGRWWWWQNQFCCRSRC